MNIIKNIVLPVVLAALLCCPARAAADGLDLSLNLDLFTLTHTPGGEINHFAMLDFLAVWPRFEHWNLYAGVGVGMLAVRARLGVDIHPWGRSRAGLMARAGGRYVVAIWVGGDPSGFDNFDSAQDSAHGPMGELGIGYRWPLKTVNWIILGHYLAGPMFPIKGGVKPEDRKPGATDPTGTAVFQGGTVSLGIEW